MRSPSPGDAEAAPAGVIEPGGDERGSAARGDAIGVVASRGSRLACGLLFSLLWPTKEHVDEAAASCNRSSAAAAASVKCVLMT